MSKFLALPDDMHIRVLETLDFWSLIACEQTCGALRRLTTENARLRYVRASLATGKHPLPHPTASSKALLEAFLPHEHAWSNPRPLLARAASHIITLLNRLPHEYDHATTEHHVTDRALYVLFDRGYLVVARVDLDTGEVQDPWIEERGVDVEGDRAVMAVDEAQDLVVVTHRRGGRGLSVRCYSIRDGRPHPEATPVIEYPLQATCFSPSIYGSYLCIRYDENAQDGIVVLDWRATPDSEIFLPHGLAAAFLSPEIIIFQQTDRLECLRVPSDPDGDGDRETASLFALALPPLRPGWHYGPVHMLVPAARPFVTPDSPTPNSGSGLGATAPDTPADPRALEAPFVVVLLNIHPTAVRGRSRTASHGPATGREQCWYLLIDRTSLVQDPPISTFPPTGTPTPLAWSEWSTSFPTTLLGPISPRANWGIPLGNRLLIPLNSPEDGCALDVHTFLPSIPRALVDVFDLDPLPSTNTSPFVHPPAREMRSTQATHRLPGDGRDYFCGPRHIVSSRRIQPSHDEVLEVWRLY